MLAVYKHELGMHFKGMSAYLFSAFLLLFIGLYTMMYNLNYGVTNFEYVLSNASMVYVVVIPLLTMRSLAQEKSQKTDQLLYSLPLNMWEVVVGKFLALATVLALPMAITCIYPLVLKQYGDVYLPQAYSAIAGFFLLGCALIAIGVFVSSLVESQMAAAGICFAVTLLNYLLSTLSSYIPTTAQASYIAVVAAVLLLSFVLDHMLKNGTVTFIIFIVAQAAVSITYFFKSELFESLVPNFVDQIALFERFEVFTNGLFDWTGVVYLLSVAAVFLFLSVQSLEKRRWS